MYNAHVPHNVISLKDYESAGCSYVKGMLYKAMERSGTYLVTDSNGVPCAVENFLEYFTVASDCGLPAAYVDRFWAGRKDGWAVQLMDREGNQIGDTYWDAWRPGAERVEGEWCERYGVPTRKLWERKSKRESNRKHGES